ncbi:MAG: hypothetical protein AAGF01_05000 [Cyanobacteria bacterium P01_G01_bin.38]
METIVAAHGHKTSALYGVQSAGAQARCDQLQAQLALAESLDARDVGVAASATIFDIPGVGKHH